MSSQAYSPPREEGWPRHQENAAELPLTERPGWSLTNTVARKRPPRLRASFGSFAAFSFSAQPPLLTRRGMSLTQTRRPIHSVINANVQIEPPVGMTPAA